MAIATTPKQDNDMFAVINAINQRHRRFINIAKHIDLLSPKRPSSAVKIKTVRKIIKIEPKIKNAPPVNPKQFWERKRLVFSSCTSR